MSTPGIAWTKRGEASIKAWCGNGPGFELGTAFVTRRVLAGRHESQARSGSPLPRSQEPNRESSSGADNKPKIPSHRSHDDVASHAIPVAVRLRHAPGRRGTACLAVGLQKLFDPHQILRRVDTRAR